MALSDLMKRGYLTSATATQATPATHRGTSRPTVATVAGVAVAPPPKSDSSSLLGALELFKFERVLAEIEADYPELEINRINNMAWEFMQADQMPFGEANKLAAEIVIEGKWSACESAYVDVLALFKRLGPKGAN